MIDADSDVAARVIAAAARRAGRAPFTVGARRARTIRLAERRREGFATRLKLAYAGRDLRRAAAAAGEFQVSNALVAAGLCIATGGDPAAVFAALEKLEGAPGRLERVGEKRGAPVFVDYAHKPDALEKALAALRPSSRGRLVVVFGCGGDRDAGKRPMMGAIAARARRRRHRHRRQSALRGPGRDPRRHPRRGAAARARSATAPQAIRDAVRILQPGDALVDRRQRP